jgi:hypothetical protein
MVGWLKLGWTLTRCDIMCFADKLHNADVMIREDVSAEYIVVCVY